MSEFETEHLKDKAWQIADEIVEAIEFAVKQANGVNSDNGKCAIPVVSQRSELLISYTKWLRQRSLYEGNFTEQQLVDAYNKEINCW